MRAFVTGGSGFVGQHLIRALVSRQTLHLPGAPPVNTVLLALVGGEFTLNDAKARRELGYQGHYSREEGLAALRARFLTAQK